VSALLFERSGRDRVVAGVCGGLAIRLAVDATLVRLVFAILALAGGAGILLYLALWAYSSGRRKWPAAVLIAVAAATLLSALGFSRSAIIGASLLSAGLAVVLVRGGSLRPGGSLPRAGVVLLMAGAVLFLGRSGASGAFLAPGAIAGALVLVVGPWLWRLAAERSERIRLEERAEVAARIHDSVLQTLALVQRHSGDAGRVSAIARRQERELRRWLYGSGVAEAASLVDALADAAADIEELHRARIELASAGDVPLADDTSQLVLAAREAMTNAAKFSGADEISVYAEVSATAVTVFVRDRGFGFDRGAVAADRRGIAESIEARMQRAGGSATILTAPGAGTEIELSLPRKSQ
jgi:signal transduction histidine kinase